jgi:hypothetical protein
MKQQRLHVKLSGLMVTVSPWGGSGRPVRKRKMRITLAGLLIGALVVGVGAALVLPAVRPSRHEREVRARDECISNLRDIALAKRALWRESDGSTAVFSNAVGLAARTEWSSFYCPLLEGTNRTFESSYSLNGLGDPTCKIGHSNYNHRLDWDRPDK